MNIDAFARNRSARYLNSHCSLCVAFLVSIAPLIGCGEPDKRSVKENTDQPSGDDPAERPSNGRARDQMATLSEMHNAELSWLGNTGKSDSETVFSLQIQRELESTGSSSLMILGCVVDVYKDGTNYGVICQWEPGSAYWNLWKRDVFFVLQTDMQTADTIISEHNSATDSVLEPPYFAFVIRATESRVKFVHDIYADGEYIVEGDEEPKESYPADAQIVDAGLRPSMTIYGEIVDFTLLEDYDPWAEE